VGPRDDLEIRLQASYKTGQAVVAQLINNTSESITLSNDCPNEPFNLLRYENGQWVAVTALANEKRCTPGDLVIESGKGFASSFQPWQKDLFQEAGKYRLEIPLALAGTEKTFFKEFEIKEPGFFGTLWRTVVYRPIYNLLIWFIDIMPGHSFGWGIILLTLLIRALLFVPFQKSLKSQRRMQQIQPELDAVKKRYAGNQQMIAMETMALMKKYKVNPFSSCLPILIQMPFLIAVFYVTKDGLGENNFLHLYSFLKDFDLAAVSTNFYGLKLLGPGAQLYFALPISLALVQFAQMKLALHHGKKNKSQNPNENPMADAMQNMSKMMPYVMPLMIGFFSISMPAAVGLYWGVSTLFGVGQQLVVNRQIK
jgi:YidC/Oxa1 family membrane protein insertase